MSKYHFDITPHIVKQLGEQLVSDEITALLELIKNSYDADASYVSIEINTTGNYLKDKLFYPDHNGFIVVEDDGFGMSEETIMKSWLLISYSQKRAQLKKQKTPKGRTPLGEKGLGRLSTQRLGNICEIFTWENQKEGIHLGFDWQDFEKVEALSQVPIKRELSLAKKNQGTTLVLADLNNSEVWMGKNLEKFKGQVTQVISPYKDNRPFEVFLKINGQAIELDKYNEELSDLAISKFNFSLKGNLLEITGKTKIFKFLGNDIARKDDFYNFILADQGKKLFSFLREKISDIELSNPPYFIEFKRTFDIEKDLPWLEIYDGKRANPGEFSGILNEFTYKNEQLQEEKLSNEIFGQFSSYKEFAQAQIGVKIYRNGFSVLPYGIDEKNKDWLGFSSSQTKTSFFDLRPDNVIGYISIDEGENHELKDKTDRTGLISNSFSRNFFSILQFTKDQINSYQRSVRKNTETFINLYKTENSGIKTVSQAFNQLKETKTKTEEVKEEFKDAIITVNKAIKDSERIVKTVKGDPLFSTELEKETASRVEEILNELKAIQTTLQKLENVVNKAEKLNEVIDILEPKIKILEEQLSNFSELASLGLTTESVSHEFASIADRLAEKANFYSNKLENKKLTDTDIYVLMEYINTTVNGLKVQLRHLDPALKYNREKKTTFKLSQFLNEEKEYYNNRFEKLGIEFVVDNIDDFTVTINRGKLTQILDNLLNNSQYWLKERKQNEKDFKPKIFIKIEAPWVYVYDNGFGITPAVENQIFEPFVTTKPKGEGRGLGLFIIQQLLDSSGCSIILEPTKNEHKRKFMFAMNLSNIIK